MYGGGPGTGAGPPSPAYTHRVYLPMSTMADRIEINPRVMMGKPVIRGTRITVELLLRKISEGATEGDLLDAYPRFQREDIRAAAAYAAE